MDVAVLLDFGSTFTKLRVVHLGTAEVVRSAQAPTTDETGLTDCLDRVMAAVGPEVCIGRAAFVGACSSAAGGLKVVVLGLEPELTVTAARAAALGAGARLIGTWSRVLTDRDVREIERLEPDLVLLTGGTDGGDCRTVLSNARLLATLMKPPRVVYAGNRVVADEVVEILSSGGVAVYVADNVLPELQKLNVDPVRRLIRQLFMEHIVLAKGFDPVREMLGVDIVPTPAAVLEGLTLLSRGARDGAGFGDVVLVDVGGATTDVHSIATGAPTQGQVVWQGIPEPVEKRTVEGDLGLRVNATRVVDALEEDVSLRRHLGSVPMERVSSWAQRVSARRSIVAATEEEGGCDQVLAAVAVDVAVGRHVGRIERRYGAAGEVLIQYGKDLSKVGLVIGCGGVFANARVDATALAAAIRPDQPDQLRPASPELRIDTGYTAAAAGLLASRYPEVGFRMFSRSLRPLGSHERMGIA